MSLGICSWSRTNNFKVQRPYETVQLSDQAFLGSQVLGPGLLGRVLAGFRVNIGALMIRIGFRTDFIFYKYNNPKDPCTQIVYTLA